MGPSTQTNCHDSVRGVTGTRFSILQPGVLFGGREEQYPIQRNESQCTGLVLYRDVRSLGFKELYYFKARQKGVLFFRYIPEEKPLVYDNSGKLIVDFTDRSSHQDFRVEPDLVVLSAGIRPGEGARQIARLLKLPTADMGFFLEAHVKLRPVEFATSGVFLAGLAHSPRFIEESVTMAKSAGQQAMKILCKRYHDDVCSRRRSRC